MSIGIKFRSLRGIYSQFKFSLSTLVVFSGVVVLLLGAIVLLGWYTHNTSLIQINPVFVPMQYNTALGFLLSGVMLLFMNTNRKIIFTLIGSIVLLIGLITLLEYIFVLDLFIDELFMDHYITIKTSTPGRLAPNTALCFTLTGFAALYHVLFEHKRDVAAILGLVGALIFGLGLVAFTGYFLEMETTYSWGKLTNMAIHTAAGFIVIGSGYTFLSWKLGKLSRSSLPHWLPFPILIACLTITISIWQALYVQERNIVAQFGSEYANLADNFILVFGILLSVALAFSIRLIIIVRSHLQERLKAEKELNKSEKNFRTYFEQSLIGMVITSVEKGFIEANDAFCDMFGYSFKELSNMTWEEMTFPDDLELDLAQFRRLLAGEINNYSLEKRFIHKDGRVVSTAISVSAINKTDDDSVDYILAIAENITKRMQAEDKLTKYRDHLEELVKERTTELEEKNLELKRFKNTTIDREFRMKELRNKVKELEKKLSE